ncbi:MAG: P-loop NTPase fold protein, partial [Pseudolabrys sp.]|nr:P-loop NTPase fold protein [Pseudolabrys sp.]
MVGPQSPKTTHFLTDDPSSTDEFGPHSRLARLIRDEIADATNGRTIALVGEWGSGKSTTVKLLEQELVGLPIQGIKAHIFPYDAWSHQGDPLRRSFLDDLITFLKEKELISPDEAKKATQAVWNRQEITETTSEPVLRTHAKLLFLFLAFVPIGMRLFDFPVDAEVEDVFSIRNLIALAMMSSFLFLLGFFALINNSKHTQLRRYLFGVTEDDKSFSVFSFFFEKVSGKIERKFINTPADSIIEFK